MSRLGKIGRLPRAVRDVLNCRLHEGEGGAELLAWLNAEPVVQEVLARHFDGVPINAQNLSDWRRGGYADWCQQQILELAERLHEEGEELDALDGSKLAGHLTLASTLAVAGRLRAAERMEEGPAKFRAVMASVRAVDRLRRTEIEAGRAKREAEVAEREVRPGPSEAGRSRGESSTGREAHRGALATAAPAAVAPVAGPVRPVAAMAKKAAVVEPAATAGVAGRPSGVLAVPAAAAVSKPSVPAASAASAKTGGFVYPWMNGAEEGFRELGAITTARAA